MSEKILSLKRREKDIQKLLTSGFKFEWKSLDSNEINVTFNGPENTPY